MEITQLRQAIIRQFGFRGQWRCGAEAGISETVISAIVNGRRVPTSEQKRSLAKVLECEESEIFPGKKAA